MPSAFVVYACLGRRPGRFEHHGTYLCLYAECVYVLASTLASMCAMANELYQLCAVCLLWLSFPASQVRLSCRACGGFVAELKGAVPLGHSHCRHAANWCSKTLTPQWPGAQTYDTHTVSAMLVIKRRWPWCWPSVMPKSQGAASLCSRSEAHCRYPRVELDARKHNFAPHDGADSRFGRSSKAIGDEVLLRHAYWPKPQLQGLQSLG